MTFAQVPVGTVFQRCSTLWRKRSTRTAEIVFGTGRGLWFYWGQCEPVDGVVK